MICRWHRTSRRLASWRPSGRGLRDRRRAGRASSPRSRSPRRGGRVLVLESGGAGPRAAAAGAVGGREPRSRRPTTRRRSPSRAGSAAPRTSGAGAACRSTRSTSPPGPGSALAGLADRPGDLAPWLGAGLRRARGRRAGLRRAAARGRGRRRPSASRASSAGATGRGSRSCTRAALAARPDLMVALGATVDRLRATARTAGSPALELHLEGRGQGGAAGRRASCSPPAATRAPGSCSLEQARGARALRRRRTARSGASTWATSTARSPTSSSRTAALARRARLPRRRPRLLRPPPAGARPTATQARGAAGQRRLLAGGAADRRPGAPLGAAVGGLPRALGRRRSGGG